MLKHLLNFLLSSFKSRQILTLENMPLRHQLEVRMLIRQMSQENRLWGAPRIQAFPFDTAPRFLIRNRDVIYGQCGMDTGLNCCEDICAVHNIG